MSRLRATVLFLLAATAANAVLIFLYFLTFQGLAALFLPARTGVVALLVTGGLGVGAILAAWYTSRWFYRLLRSHWDFETRFDLGLFRDLF